MTYGIIAERPRWGWQALATVCILLAGILVWCLVWMGLLFFFLSAYDDINIYMGLLLLFVPPISTGVVVGLAHWFSLGRQRVTLSRWIILSIMGWLGGQVCVFLQSLQHKQLLILAIAMSCVLVVAFVSIGRWALLRKHMPGAAWWIMINTEAALLAWLIFGFFMA